MSLPTPALVPRRIVPPLRGVGVPPAPDEDAAGFEPELLPLLLLQPLATSSGAAPPVAEACKVRRRLNGCRTRSQYVESAIVHPSSYSLPRARRRTGLLRQLLTREVA